MQDEQPRKVTVEELNMYNLSEYIHNKVGEASTLFHENKDGVFNEKHALELAEELIKATTKLVDDGKRELYEGGEKKFLDLLMTDGGMMFSEEVRDDTILFKVPRETLQKYFKDGELPKAKS